MKTKIFLIFIILLALFLRTFNLSNFPATLYGDEQAFAWNAYNILKLGQDEYGNSFPLEFKSFGDYKAPVPVYLLVPFIKILNLTSFAIRLPIALASTLTILIVFFLSRLFFKQKLSLITSFLMAVSPWHMHLSRGFFESTLSLLFFILGVYLFLKNCKNLKMMLFSMLFFDLSVYSYFSPRILIPLFLIFLFIYQYFESKSYRRLFIKNYCISLVCLILLALPLITSSFHEGSSRLKFLIQDADVTVVQAAVNKERTATNLTGIWNLVFHNKVTVWLRLITDNYLEHLSANFWYIYGDNSLRYFVGNMGMFYLLEGPFFIIGLYFLWREQKTASLFFVSWILIAPIPASIVGRPFAVRSLALLPAPFIFVGYGLFKSASFLHQSKFRLLAVLISLGYVISLGSLLIRYYFEYPVYAATWWGWENKAAIDYAKKSETDFDNIFISDFYSGAPMAYAVYTQYDPFKYRYALNHPVTLADGRHLIKLGKYYFGSLDINTVRKSMNIIPPKSLYIGRPEEADSNEIITAPEDGRIIFKIYKTK